MPVALTLIAVLLACLLLTIGAAVVLLAYGLLHPPRMSDGKAIWVLKRLSPRDFGWSYENVHFDVHDERGRPLRLAAWWIPATRDSDRCVVMIHGYADAKVGVIGWAKPWRDLGWNILAIDLRAHGESGGRLSTGGYFERDDLDAVLNQLRAERPHQTHELALFGVSLGAAVALACAARRDDLDALVLESPFADFRHAVQVNFEQVGAPGRWFQRAALRLAEWLSGADFDAVRPVDLVRRVRTPTFLVYGDADPFLSPSDATAMEAAVSQRSAEFGAVESWCVANAGHLDAMFVDPNRYRERVEGYLRRIKRSVISSAGESGRSPFDAATPRDSTDHQGAE